MKKLLFFSNSAKWRLLTAVLCTVLTGVFVIYEVFLIADITSRAFLGGETLAEMWNTIFVLGLVIVLRAIMFFTGEFFASHAAVQLKSDLRTKILQRIDAISPVRLRTEQRGEMLSTFTEGIEQLETYVAKYIPQAVLAGALPAAIWCVVVGFDWITAIILAVALPLLIFFMILVGWGSKRAADRQYQKMQFLSGHLFDVLRGIATLHWFQRIATQVSIIHRISEQYREATMGTLRIAFLSAFVMELFATLGTAIVAVFLGLRLLEGHIDFGRAFFLLLLVPEFFAPVRAVGVQYHAAQNGISAWKRIITWFSEHHVQTDIVHSSNQSFKNGVGQMSITINQIHSIAFTDVQVNSVDQANPILKQIHCRLSPGKAIAITGPSGSGKSTFLETLCGWHPMASGSILINEMDRQELSFETWQSRIAYCSQQTDWIRASIRENLCLYRPDATECEIWDALHRVRLTDWIAELPNGLETILYDDAIISGGQAQRLQIARAFISKRPLLLLDEAISQVDVQNAMWIQKQLCTWVREKPNEHFFIYIAHHQEQVFMADHILEMKNGRLLQGNGRAAVS